MSSRLGSGSAPLEQGGGGRVDGELKVTGQMTYAADVSLPGLLHVAVLRSPYPHARITALDTAAAAQMPGVHSVLVGADVAHVRYGRLVQDVPLLAVDKVRFAGERVAAVAAETRSQAERAVAAIDVAYDPLPAVFDPGAALAAEAPAVHAVPWSYAGALAEAGGPPNLQARHVWTGGTDVEAALAAAEFQFEEEFSTPSTHQGYLEPHSCTAAVDSDGHIRVWASTKAPYRLRAQVARAFGLPPEQIEVNPLALGGDFGGKGSPMNVPLCVELARRTGRPVQMTMRYAEELLAGNVRHASVTRIRAGVSRDGVLQAMDVRMVFNVGAYAGFRPGANLHGAQEAGSWYRIPAMRVESTCVYTNQVPGGHKRAPGAVQANFAVESMMDIIAGGLGLDPLELRHRNLLRTGDATPLGEHWPEARGVDTLVAAERAYRPVHMEDKGSSVRWGRGVAVFSRPTHAGASSLRLCADTAGRIVAEVPQPEQGGGVHTVVRTMVARELGLAQGQIAIRHVGTAALPNDDGVGGSRVTASLSEVVPRAAEQFRQRAGALAAAQLGLDPAAVVQHPGPSWGDASGQRRLGLGELAAWAAERGEELAAQAATGRDRGHGQGALGFCVQMAQVGVDVDTGQLFIGEILTVHDVGAIINPCAHRVQIEGGVAYGVGEALLEDLAISEGKVGAANLGDYKLPSAHDVPPIRLVYLEGGRGVGLYNVKGIGEMSNVPVPAVLANAVAAAVGVRIPNLPITAEKIYFALQEARRQGAEV